MLSRCLALALLALPAGTPLGDPLPDVPEGPHGLRLETVVDGLVFPTDVAPAPDGSDRLFITLVHGYVVVVEDGVLLPTPFADLSALHHQTNGSAMAGLAFHPDFATNGLLYVVMTENEDPALADFGVLSGVAQQSVLYELQAQAAYPAAGANLEDVGARRELLRINEDSTIHNLDDLAFGPDGYLYLSKGDDETGGSDLTTIHGTVLRLDVDRKPGNALSANGEYAIPTDNPFVGAGGGVLPEIFAYGFRNPWRLGFDRATGELWVADVGQADVEEVNRVVAGGHHGWDDKEGSFATVGGGGVTDDLSGLPPVTFVDPVGQYDHDENDRSITGGVLYRGLRHPELAGRYVFADWISGRVFQMHPATGALFTVPLDPTGETVNGQLSGDPFEGVISVAEGVGGELLFVVTQRNFTATGRLLRARAPTYVEPGPGGRDGRPRQGPGVSAPGAPGTLQQPGN